jgi:hemoglobin/transferrin/lactoferrin receptor protein
VTDQDRHATATAPRTIERADVSARDFQARVVAERRLSGAHLEAGIDVNGRRGLEAYEERVLFDAAGAEVGADRTAAIERAHRTNLGVFGSIQAPLAPRVILGAGLRGERVTAANRGGFFGDRSSRHAALSGFGSITLSGPRGFSINGQVARGFRAPLLSDRYFRGPSGRGHVTGNPDLAPETSLQFDAAIRYTAPRIRAAFYAFHYRVADLIERYEDGIDVFLFRNRGRSRVRGLEAEAQAGLGAGYTVQLAAQLTRGRVIDDGGAPDGIPPASISLQLRKAVGARGFVQGRGALMARDDFPGPTERITPGYGVLDLSAGWMLSPGLEIRALGRNVLDQEFLVSADTRTVPAPGASVAVTLSVRLGGD